MNSPDHASLHCLCQETGKAINLQVIDPEVRQWAGSPKTPGEIAHFQTHTAGRVSRLDHPSLLQAVPAAEGGLEIIQ